MAEIDQAEAIRRCPELAPLAAQNWVWEARPLRESTLVLWGSRRGTRTLPAVELFIYPDFASMYYVGRDGLKHTEPNGPLDLFVRRLSVEAGRDEW
ncbi:hypothetical protein EV193_104221 [Herbihabitans rhizosphaerae]|uniref:Uncharacterized protein n=1 Tax=Herbihabitans rhizosphaerae TaxID=1872711 RepID=A0A4Q7KSC3_9PSEU|nr:hypothetical protein [Herbihabitans rhizosphaerae]RZS39010.1 hypothetical protein EV193_104221 [Herbihabitans rhizosphaerae]